RVSARAAACRRESVASGLRPLSLAAVLPSNDFLSDTTFSADCAIERANRSTSRRAPRSRFVITSDNSRRAETRHFVTSSLEMHAALAAADGVGARRSATASQIV